MEKDKAVEILRSLHHRYRLKALDVFALISPTPYGNRRNAYDDVVEALDRAIESLEIPVEKHDVRTKLLEVVADKAEELDCRRGTSREDEAFEEMQKAISKLNIEKAIRDLKDN